VATYTSEKTLPEEWDWKVLEERLFGQFGIESGISPEERDEVTPEALEERIRTLLEEAYAAQVERFGPEEMEQIERFIVIQTLDNLWKDHLLNMDHLRDGIGLRGYGQKDPLQEYKREGYDMFMAMIQRFREETISLMTRIRPMKESRVEQLEARRRREQERMSFSHGEGGGKPKTVKRKGEKVGRNDPCPCGSGKKFKKCCGKG
jgi:preprotein translocase subunit SecA